LGFYTNREKERKARGASPRNFVKKGGKKGGKLIFWGKSLGRLKKKTFRQLAGELNLKTWQIAMWSCQLGNADLTIFNLRIGLCQLCILPMWSWQGGKVNLTKYGSIWYPILMFNPVCVLTRLSMMPLVCSPISHVFINMFSMS
jgi:hypothetical protein